MTTATTAIPALRQSLTETAACEHSYAVQVIEGKQSPSGLQSHRGQEIHKVMSRYIDWCSRGSRPVEADWAKFDELATGAGSEAATILEGMRDHYKVDHQHVYATELLLRRTDPDTEGTLDVLLFLTDTEAKIEDFKSHPRPFDPNTMQSKLYPWLVFKNFPKIQTVTFELIFVRYANCRRSVTYARADMPMLDMHVRNARARQVEIHAKYEAGEKLEATPSNQCQYCPLLATVNACPIAEFNPHGTMPMPERLSYAIWLQQQKKLNDQIMKDFVDATGKPIETRDGNGKLYTIGVVASESKQYPLLPTFQQLLEYREATPEDTEWIGKLLISSSKLKSYLKAKKRSFLHQSIEDNAAITVTKAKFKITAAAEVDEGEDDEEFDS